MSLSIATADVENVTTLDSPILLSKRTKKRALNKPVDYRDHVVLSKGVYIACWHPTEGERYHGMSSRQVCITER